MEGEERCWKVRRGARKVRRGVRRWGEVLEDEVSCEEGEVRFWKKSRGVGRRGEVLEGEVRCWKVR